MNVPKRILYVQYTNPALYPPLAHSSQILSESGWNVLFLGVRDSASDAVRFPVHPGIRCRYLTACAPGLWQKIHFAYFCVWVVFYAFWWRPHWIYASQPFSAPAAIGASWARTGRVLYHEHDSPSAKPRSLFDRCILAARRRLAQRSDICVLPTSARIPFFIESTRVSSDKVVCVWNCPRRAEADLPASRAQTPFVLYYHGNINRELLPITLLDALALLPDAVVLRVIGYETIGSVGYVREFMNGAAERGLEGRVAFLGAFPRAQVLAHARECHLGVCLLPATSENINMTHMAGASNKAFDYLACGMPLLVSDLDEWRALFVDGQLALPCNPALAESIVEAVSWFLRNPDASRQMGERGRQQVQAHWNYEAQFQPVLAGLNSR